MFIFLLTPFDTKECYCFESNLSLVLLIIKVCNIVLKSSKHEEAYFPHDFIFVSSLFHWDNIVKKCFQKWWFGKKTKSGRMLSIEEGSNLLHTMLY